jgi:hypothetical protein
MNGAPSMSGSLKGFVTLAKQNNPGIVFTHCFLHREAFNSKSAVSEVLRVLRQSKWLRTSRIGHYSRGCFQHRFPPRKLWGARIKKENNFGMFELTKSCRLDKNLVNLILQSLSLLNKNTEKYLLPLDVSSLDWVRDPFVLSAFKSAELTVAEEDTLMDIRNDRILKLKHSSTDMASFWLSL